LESKAFVNYAVSPKWYLATFDTALLVITYASHRLWGTFTTRNQNRGVPVLIGAVAGSSFLVALQGTLQFFEVLKANGVFRVTGSLDNPAGLAACLCAGFPAGLYFHNQPGKWKKKAAAFAGVTIILSIVLSGSRAGMLSLAVVCPFWLLKQLSVKLKSKHIIVIAEFFCYLLLVFTF